MMGGLFMGQAKGNRLENVSIPAIVGRIQIAPVVQAYLKKLKDTPPPSKFGRRYEAQASHGPPPTFPPMTDAEAQILFEVSQNPTPDELDDLSLIDSLLSPAFEQGMTTTAEICYGASQRPGTYRPRRWRWGGYNRGLHVPEPGGIGLIEFLVPPPPMDTGGGWRAQQQHQQLEKQDLSFLGNEFWCTDPTTSPISQTFINEFGIDTSKKWGEEKQAVKNGQVMLGVKGAYSFPPPIDQAPDALWNRLYPDLAKIAHVVPHIDPESFRAWLTLKTLKLYTDVANAMIEDQKRAAKRKKRKALLRAIVFTVASIVLAFVLPEAIPALVSATKAAFDAYTAAKDRRLAAKALADASKLFATDAPAFAADVQKTADMLDYEAAQAQAAAPLTPEQLDAIKDIESITPPSTPVGTYVVGGVAATGLIAALVTLLK